MPQVQWRGTQDEAFDLMTAIAHQCSCRFGPQHERLTTCAPHQMLLEEQETIDHLIFVRRALAERLLREEFGR